MSLAKAAHKAMHDALLANSDLTALVGTRVYDRVPVVATYPYITFEIDTRDDANTCSNAREVHVTMHIWSNAVGKVEAETIGGIVRPILAPDDPDSNLAITGFVTYSSTCDVEVYRSGLDTLVTEGVLTFTYPTDPA